MTREIKFRGKDLDTGEWVYGNLLQDSGLCFIVKNIDELTEKPFNGCLVNPDTVGQYTGLEDRNWKEIYEGDTVGYRFTDSSFVTGKVVWWGARCGFYIRTRENDYYELTEHCQAIDTFHDNPELLEEEK